jgi:hypothetical protein
MEVEYEITEILTPETKVCATCQVEKPLTEFNKKREGKVRSECKSCQSAYWFRWKEGKDIVMDTSTDDALYVMSISKLPGIVKIGRSKHPRERAFQLALSMPFLVNVDHQYEKYGFLERMIHSKLLPYRVEDGTGKEWFYVNWQQADTIIRGSIVEYELSIRQEDTCVQVAQT